jgi:protein phosphatase methylesterase 1
MEVLTYVHQKYTNKTIIVVGHSMGGAIATKTVRKIERELAGSELALAIGGVVIIDVVEGTAMEALPFMEQIVKNRPVHFPDLQSVIRYGVIGGQVRDKRSARISMPA